jgi:carboxypeptidase T
MKNPSFKSILFFIFLVNTSFAQKKCTQFIVTDPTNYKAGTIGGYLTYTECLAELDKMKALYPNLITTKDTISNFLTFEKRPIHFVKISDNPNVNEAEKRILYTSIHHSNEPNSMQQLIYFMWYVLENYNTDAEIKKLVNTTEIFCVPIVNPDGYVFNETTNPTGGGTWRKNRRDHNDGQFGVDLNRNYSFKWGNSTPTSSKNYCGTTPFSEPETQAIKWLCEQKQFKVAINAHTYGKQIFYPHGYAAVQTPDSTEFKVVSEEMTRYNGYKSVLSASEGTTPGDSDDWMYIATPTKPSIFAFTPEVGGSYWENATNILKNNQNMVHTNLTALRNVHNYTIFTDKSDNIIPTFTFHNQYKLHKFGLAGNQNLTLSVVPVSNNITSIGLQKF